MTEGFTGGRRHLQDRRMWRLLLARLHPDAGGDHDLFLLACDAMEELCGGRRASPRRDGPGPDHTFSDWRGGMTSWASRNREGLRRPHKPRRGR